MAGKGMGKLIASTGFGPRPNSSGGQQYGLGNGGGTSNASAGAKMGKGLPSRLTGSTNVAGTPGITAMPQPAVAATGKAAISAARAQKKALNGG